MKKITWEFLLKYSYGRKRRSNSIIFRQQDNYFIGFNRFGFVKLFMCPDWWKDYVIISKNMSYEDMFEIIKQLKEQLTPPTKNLKELAEQKKSKKIKKS